MKLIKLMAMGIAMTVAILAIGACGADATPAPVVVEKEVPIEVIKEVVVTVEVPVVIEKEVPVIIEKEVPVVIEKEVAIEVPVTRLVVATPTPGPQPTAVPQVTRLRVAVPLERDTNDPHTGGIDPFIVGGPVFEGLAEEAPDLKIKPMLATDWSLSSDGTSWTFKLRKGVPFHSNFGEFSAKDVKLTLERYIRKEAGTTEKPRFTGILGGMEIIDDHTVKFNTPIIEPTLCCDKKFINRYWGATLSKDFFDKEGQDGIERTMIGTGPYQFVERELSTNILYERVPYKHWRVTPDFEELELIYAKESSTRLAMILAGEAHLSIIPHDLQAVAAAAGMKIIPAVSATAPLYAVFGGNQLSSKPSYDPTIPWTNRKVREALNRAINRKELQDTLLGGKGDPMLVSFWSASLPGWNPKWESTFEADYGYDPDRAKALLAEAGPLDWAGTSFMLAPKAEVPEMEDIGEAIANYWKAVGVDIAFEKSEWLPALLKFVFHTANRKSMVNASERYVDPGMFNVPYSTTGCCHFFESELLETKIKELSVTADPSKRESILSTMGNHLYEEYATVPLFWLSTDFVVNPTVVADYQTSGAAPPRNLEYVKATR